jgi:hypothetical protein
VLAQVLVGPTGAETELLVNAGDAQIVLRTQRRTSASSGDNIGLTRCGDDPSLRQASGVRIAP